jgi:hypothetical protein
MAIHSSRLEERKAGLYCVSDHFIVRYLSYFCSFLFVIIIDSSPTFYQCCIAARLWQEKQQFTMTSQLLKILNDAAAPHFLYQDILSWASEAKGNK